MAHATAQVCETNHTPQQIIYEDTFESETISPHWSGDIQSVAAGITGRSAKILTGAGARLQLSDTTEYRYRITLQVKAIPNTGGTTSYVCIQNPGVPGSPVLYIDLADGQVHEVAFDYQQEHAGQGLYIGNPWPEYPDASPAFLLDNVTVVRTQRPQRVYDTAFSEPELDPKTWIENFSWVPQGINGPSLSLPSMARGGFMARNVSTGTYELSMQLKKITNVNPGDVLPIYVAYTDQQFPVQIKDGEVVRFTQQFYLEGETLFLMMGRWYPIVPTDPVDTPGVFIDNFSVTRIHELPPLPPFPPEPNQPVPGLPIEQYTPTYQRTGNVIRSLALPGYNGSPVSHYEVLQWAAYSSGETVAVPWTRVNPSGQLTLSVPPPSTPGATGGIRFIVTAVGESGRFSAESFEQI